VIGRAFINIFYRQQDFFIRESNQAGKISLKLVFTGNGIVVGVVVGGIRALITQ